MCILRPRGWCFKRVKTETDSDWDPNSPARKDVIDNCSTPKSSDTPKTPSSLGRTVSLAETPPSVHSVEASHGSSVLNTPKFLDQTEPAEAINYSPTHASGKELEDRKSGIYKRPKAGYNFFLDSPPFR